MASIDERLKALEEKEAKIKAQRELLENKLKAETRKARNRQNIVVGAMLIDHAYSDSAEAKKLISILEKKATREQDKKTLAPLLAELKALVNAGKAPPETAEKP